MRLAAPPESEMSHTRYRSSCLHSFNNVVVLNMWAPPLVTTTRADANIVTDLAYNLSSSLVYIVLT